MGRLLACLREAESLAETLDDPRRLGQVLLFLSSYFCDRGASDQSLAAAQRYPPEGTQAEAQYHQALALAEELGMRPLQGHCHRDLGTLYAATGRREQARVELTAAISLYRAMDMTFWLPQAEVALAQVVVSGLGS